MALPRRTKILAIAALGIWATYGILRMVFPSEPSEPAPPVWGDDHPPVWVGDHYVYRIWRKCRDPERELGCGPWQDGPMPEEFFDGGRD
jgi:hypothetical protein